MTSTDRTSKRSIAKPRDFLAGGGEMAKLIGAKNWSETPLGPIHKWPRSLRTTVSLCLASNFPISLAWGPECTQIYNDGYRIICGAKHPRALGQDFRECWASAWPVIGEAYEAAERGETRFLENRRLFIDRNGYLEETFFTFSFSPIRDKGGVQGLFHPVTETTASMLSERRTRALHDLASATQGSTSVHAVCTAVAAVLAGYEYDVPFVLIYLPGEGEDLQLAASAGIEPDSLASVSRIWPDEQTAIPLAQALSSNKPQMMSPLAGQFEGCARGPYPERPCRAIALPIAWPGVNHRTGVIVAGISPRLPLDDAYRNFCDLLASQVATAIASARAYEDERRRVEALAALDQSKTAFFSSVSHEFRTPLTLMLGPLEQLLATPENANGHRDQLQLIYRNALRLLRLVNSLLDFSRIEAGRAQALFEPVDLAVLTADIASSFRSAVESAGLRFVVDCPASPEPAPAEPAYVDRSMWETIILNLLSNALKFTFSGEIAVTLRERGGEVELRVADTGTGIPASELPRLFERFYRAEGARGRTFEGTGIGLSLVQELVKLHGGQVVVESDPGRGSAFTVSLPAGFAHLPASQLGAPNGSALLQTNTRRQGFLEESLRWLPGVPDAHPADRPAGPQSGSPRSRILLADDNADMRQYIERLLAGDYDVHSVSNGAEALSSALRHPPDLVISDVMMPELDGFGLLAALRGDERTRLVPLVLLSARAGEEARTEGIGAGADDYLVKPFAARELLARVRTRIEITKIRSELHELRAARRNTEAMERQWRLFDTVLSHTPDHVYIYDLSHRFLYANRAVLSFWGKPSEEWIGRTPSELGLPPGLASTVDGHVSQVIASGQPLRHELIVTGPGGEDRDYEYIFTPVFADSGQVQAVAGTSREITGRKNTERRLQLVIEAASSAMIMVAAGGRIVLVNKETERLFGYGRGELLGQPVEMLVPERFRTGHADLRNAFHAAPAARAMGAGQELFGLRRDGSEVPVEIGLNPVVAPEGPAVLASVVDITARKQASLEREEFIARLSSALAEKTVLIQEVHHRVKNNMAVISGLLGAQADALEDGPARVGLEEGQRRIQAMSMIHEQLYGHENLDRVNFGQYAQGLVHDLGSFFAKTSARASVKVDAEDIDLAVDRAIPCGLILNELVSNAFKYAFPDKRSGEIGVRFARLPSGELSLSCRDDGVGIPDGFDWRNSSSLGLRIVGILSKQIGGEVTLDRSAGGTRFEVRFPHA